MSGFDHSHPQCSADASSGVDGSGLHPSPSPAPSTAAAAVFPETAATSAASIHFSDLRSRPPMTDPQSPDAPDAYATDEAEQDLLPPLPPLNTDCESLPIHADDSSPSGSRLLDSSSPRTTSPTLSVATTASSSSSNSRSHYDAEQVDTDECVAGAHRETLPSPGNETPALQYSAPALNRLLTPPYSSSLSSLPDGGTLTPQDDDGNSSVNAIQDTDPSIGGVAAEGQLSATSSDSDVMQTSSSLHHNLVANSQDVCMDSVYEDSDISSDENDALGSNNEENSADNDYLEGASSDNIISPYTPADPGPSSTETASGTTDQPLQSILNESPAAEMPTFELFEAGNDELMEFDFAGFLDQLPDPMDLDNPTFNTAVSPQNIPITIPQGIFPPHIQPIPQQWITNHPNLPFNILQGAGNGFLAFTATIDDSPEWPGPQFHGEYERNLSFADFCNMLTVKYRQDPIANAECKINPDFVEILNFHLPNELNREEVDDYCPDYQGIPWRELDMERHRFRLLRNKKYSNYANMKPYPEPHRVPQFLPIRENLFQFRKTCNNLGVRFSHFQLRNVISAVSKNDVFYTGDSIVSRLDPQTGLTDTVMDLRRPYSGDPVKITTLASDFGVLIAGGFYGEYSMKSLDAPLSSKPVEGLVTTDSNGITNHVHFFQSRTTSTPRAVFSSNDERLRILDCYRNKIVEEFRLPWAINCSATSPDGRLRVIVGDAREVVIQGADDGETIHQLPGHQDYGFACAWSDDGHTIATGNQDMMVRVYDARNFKREVAVLDADIAGARSLRFTPVGSGPRVLAFAEPADMVSIVDAVTWESRQRIDFFGEIAGISFSPTGRELYIANSDKVVGGLMVFDRWKSGVPGHLDDDDDDRRDAGQYDEPRISRRRMRLRDINLDFLGVI
ncbi:hypothetical protein Dda_1315 [Drechslerella dactyloides]|uniref:Uncharacterized protein n=1 Tax=Drechslerella dactyloides TaxID=74499 RepID=A0AAD6J1K3_DREDA|nr:hypothetical protein Dda_1315 [Drechslerella dactyloides]